MLGNDSSDGCKGDEEPVGEERDEQGSKEGRGPRRTGATRTWPAWLAELAGTLSGHRGILRA